MCSTSSCRYWRKGELQDNLGHTVSFRNTVMIMTSNVGAREISRESAVGFPGAPKGFWTTGR